MYIVATLGLAFTTDDGENCHIMLKSIFDKERKRVRISIMMVVEIYSNSVVNITLSM